MLASRCLFGKFPPLHGTPDSLVLTFFVFHFRVGKGASKLEKRAALQYAQDYLIAYKKPLATPISRILEGGENEVFENSFDH